MAAKTTKKDPRTAEPKKRRCCYHVVEIHLFARNKAHAMRLLEEYENLNGGHVPYSGGMIRKATREEVADARESQVLEEFA